MATIAAIAEELLLSAVINDNVLLPRRKKAEWGLMALCVLFIAAGVLFLALALNRYLEDIYPRDVAALASAVLVFAAAGLCGVMAARMHRRKAIGIRGARRELGRNIRAFIDDVSRELDDPVKDHPKTAMLVAAMAGFFAMNHQQTRRAA